MWAATVEADSAPSYSVIALMPVYTEDAFTTSTPAFYVTCKTLKSVTIHFLHLPRYALGTYQPSCFY